MVFAHRPGAGYLHEKLLYQKIKSWNRVARNGLLTLARGFWGARRTLGQKKSKNIPKTSNVCNWRIYSFLNILWFLGPVCRFFEFFWTFVPVCGHLQKARTSHCAHVFWIDGQDPSRTSLGTTLRRKCWSEVLQHLLPSSIWRKFLFNFRNNKGFLKTYCSS